MSTTVRKDQERHDPPLSRRERVLASGRRVGKRDAEALERLRQS